MKSKITNASCEALRPLLDRARAIPACAGSVASPRCNAASIIIAPRPPLHAAAGPSRGERRTIRSHCCANGSRISCCPSPCGVASCAAARSASAPLASSPLWPAGRARPCARGRDAGAHRASARAARCRARCTASAGVSGTPARKCLAWWRNPRSRRVATKICRRRSVRGLRRFVGPLWLLRARAELDSQRGRPRHGGALAVAGRSRNASKAAGGTAADVQRDYYVAQ